MALTTSLCLYYRKEQCFVLIHHLGASRCKCVPIVPIKQHGFIPFLYRIMPKIDSLVAKINRHLQRDVKRWCTLDYLSFRDVPVFGTSRQSADPTRFRNGRYAILQTLFFNKICHRVSIYRKPHGVGRFKGGRR